MMMSIDLSFEWITFRKSKQWGRRHQPQQRDGLQFRARGNEFISTPERVWVREAKNWVYLRKWPRGLAWEPRLSFRPSKPSRPPSSKDPSCQRSRSVAGGQDPSSERSSGLCWGASDGKRTKPTWQAVPGQTSRGGLEQIRIDGSNCDWRHLVCIPCQKFNSS